MSTNQPTNQQKKQLRNRKQRTQFYHELIKNCRYKQTEHPTQFFFGGGGSIILTCHNWSTGDVVVKELSKVGQIWREAGADLDLIVTVMNHITHPPGAREGVAVYTLNPRHFYPQEMKAKSQYQQNLQILFQKCDFKKW